MMFRLFYQSIFSFLLLATYSAPAFAEGNRDEQEIGTVTVRLFHQICINKIFQMPEADQFLEKFSHLPPEKEAIFRDITQSSQNSEVWVMNFPKVNVLVVTDPDRHACHVLGDKEVDFESVGAEFKKAIDGFNSSKAVIASFHKEPETSSAASIRHNLEVSYIFPRKRTELMVVASSRNGQNPTGQVAFFYTMIAKPWNE